MISSLVSPIEAGMTGSITILQHWWRTDMMAVDLICCPYDSGRRDWRCGLGPGRILRQQAVARLQRAEASVRLVEIEAHVDYESEGALVFEAQRQISEHVGKARSAGHMPLVLAGNCNAAVGAVSGIGGPGLGVVWFDAHGDFNTPDTTESGFLDGMGLAMTVGRCWQHALSTVPGYRPTPEAATVLVGARDLDPWEIDGLTNSSVANLHVSDIRSKGLRQTFKPLLERFVREVDRVYLHIDIDVHDPAEAPANHYNAPGGLSSSEVREAISFIGQNIEVAGGGISSYDPSFDPNGDTAEIAVGVLEALVSAFRKH
jgi:arginase